MNVNGAVPMPTNNKEEAFAELVREYENSWVAIVEEDGKECVVGHGSTAVEAKNEATVKGYLQVLLFRVPSFDTRFIY
jgi:Family of unknown function (DUF5678)